ncbi:MAG: hypothetical protein ABH836_04705 [Candidatus Omnitrophota bacterium]
MGNFSKAVSEALKEAEVKTENLGLELKSLEFQEKNTFESPPREWIQDRLNNLHEILNKNTTSSALALKELLETIQLEPVSNRDEGFYEFFNALDSPDKPENDNEGKFKPYCSPYKNSNPCPIG